MVKKLLFVTTRLFWPTDSGRKVSLYYYCKGLHEKYGYDIYVYSFLEHGQTTSLLKDKPDFIKEVRIASYVGKVTKLKNLIIKSFLTMSWPLQCSLFFSKKNSGDITNYIKDIQPDIVMVDMVRLAPYYEAFKDIECLKVIDMDDLLSKRYDRQLHGNSRSSIVGQYSGSMSHFMNRFINVTIIKNMVLGFEKYLMTKAEIKFGKLYDKVIFVSQKECDELNKSVGPKSLAVPLGIYKEGYLDCEYEISEQNEICFLGNMAVAANADTLHMIVTQIFPHIKSDFLFTVIGKCPDEVKDVYRDCDRIRFTGRVDSVYEYAKKSNLFLAPIAYGSGIKTKILEAMAMQLPVITNSIGAEGLDIENGKHFIVEDDYKKIAEKVDYYLNNKEDAKKIALAGQNIVFENYEWNKIWNRFEKVLTI